MVSGSNVSVVITTIAEKTSWLETVLESVERQTERPFEAVVLVDTKQTQEPLARPRPRSFPVRVCVPWSVSQEKRQHALVNEGVSLTDARTSYVMVLDDDFAFLDGKSFADLLSLSGEKVVAVPEKFFEIDLEKSGARSEEKCLRGPLADGIEELRRTRGGLDSTVWSGFYEPHYGCLFEKNKRGRELSCVNYHNFWCGHPKIISKESFWRVGGLSFAEYPHYWYCDSDMALKLLQSGVEVVVAKGLTVAHLSHPRGAYYKRQNENAAVLEAKFPGWEDRLLRREYMATGPVRTDDGRIQP